MSTFDTIKKLLKEDRSIRRFDASKSVDVEMLKELVDLTRYCASGRNAQPLCYRIVGGKSECERIYPLLKWAGYLKEWDGPIESERPVAYLVQCLDTRIASNCLCDDGIQLQAITLGAVALGLGACIIKSFNVGLVKQELALPEYMEPRYVLALGYPIEKVVIEPLNPDGDIEYYRTPDGVHHVPKRSLDSIIIS